VNLKLLHLLEYQIPKKCPISVNNEPVSPQAGVGWGSGAAVLGGTRGVITLSGALSLDVFVPQDDVSFLGAAMEN